ncbi:MAG: hypothetical protein KKA31_06730, partial [Candidatus Margulisbacteria bacterium]|nr:hypothetical protein [Candidatus Margulisiibacteriota bacterium]
FLTNNAMPYMEYYNLTIDGDLKQSLAWNYGTTFEDLSAYDNDAIPTFRTASSDPNVSAELVSWQPVEEAQAPPYTLTEFPEYISDNITMTGVYTSGNISTTFPGSEVIHAISNTSVTPSQLPFNIIASLVIIGCSLGIGYVQYKDGSNTPWLKIGVILFLMGILQATGIFDFWMIFTFIVFALTIVLARKREA